MNNIVHIADVKQRKDPDLYVNMVNNDPQHIARAKAKAVRVRQEVLRQQAAEQWYRREAAQMMFLSLLTFLGTALLIAFG